MESEKLEQLLNETASGHTHSQRRERAEVLVREVIADLASARSKDDVGALAPFLPQEVPADPPTPEHIETTLKVNLPEAVSGGTTAGTEVSAEMKDTPATEPSTEKKDA